MSSSRLKPSRNVTISVAMNNAMTIDSIETRRAQRGRTEDRAPHEQKQDAAEHGRGKRHQHDAIGEEPARVRQVGDAEAAEEFDDRVAAERDEAPEHERVRQSDDRPLADRAHLQHDVDEEPLQAAAHVVERELSRGPRQ